VNSQLAAVVLARDLGFDPARPYLEGFDPAASDALSAASNGNGSAVLGIPPSLR
jgi:hypothetical protein